MMIRQIYKISDLDNCVHSFSSERLQPIQTPSDVRSPSPRCTFSSRISDDRDLLEFSSCPRRSFSPPQYCSTEASHQSEDLRLKESTFRSRHRPLVINTYNARLEKDVVDRCARSLLWKITDDNPIEGHIVWHGIAITDEQHRVLGRSEQIVNRFPGMQELVRKRWLAKILINFQLFYPNDFNFIPPTYYLPEDSVNTIRIKQVDSSVDTVRHLLHAGDNHEQFQIPNSFNCTQWKRNNVFILKPDAGAQGVGLQLIDRYHDIPSSILGGSGSYVIQKYISNPLLLQGKKFDIRVYALITSVYPKFEAYIGTEGLTRHCTEIYKTPARSNFSNICMHFTNFSINKHNVSKFVKSEDIHAPENSKRIMSDVFNDLEASGYDINVIWSQIIDIVQKTLSALQPFLALIYQYTYKNLLGQYSRCFHILGFDILLDMSGKAWLLEVNSNPSLRMSFEDGSKLETSDNADNCWDKVPDGLASPFIRKTDDDTTISAVDETIKLPLVKEALYIVSKTNGWIGGGRISKKIRQLKESKWKKATSDSSHPIDAKVESTMTSREESISTQCSSYTIDSSDDLRISQAVDHKWEAPEENRVQKISTDSKLASVRRKFHHLRSGSNELVDVRKNPHHSPYEMTTSMDSIDNMIIEDPILIPSSSHRQIDVRSKISALNLTHWMPIAIMTSHNNNNHIKSIPSQSCCNVCPNYEIKHHPNVQSKSHLGCWNLYHQILENQNLIETKITLMSKCRCLFENVTSFPNSSVVSSLQWETFVNASGLRATMAEVHVPCLTGPSIKRLQTKNNNKFFRSASTDVFKVYSVNKGVYQSQDTASWDTSSHFKAKHSKVRQMYTSIHTSLFPTLQDRSEPTKVTIKKDDDGKLFRLCSSTEPTRRRSNTRPLAWADLKWLYSQSLSAATHQQKNTANVTKSGGIGFWSFWELLLQLSALIHISNNVDGGVARLSSNRNTIVPIQDSVNEIVINSQPLSRHRIDSTKKDSLQCGGASSLFLRKYDAEGHPLTKHQTRSFDTIGEQPMKSDHFDYTNLLDIWPDMTTMVERILQNDSANLGRTFHNFCSDLIRTLASK